LFDMNSLDAKLSAYGFTPVNSNVLYTWGIKGSFYEDSGLLFGAKVTYGNQSSGGGQIPTNISTTKMGYFMGGRIFDFMNASFEAGFGAMSFSVSSFSSGGALVYLGPYLQPTISFQIHQFRWFGEISLGYFAHFPIGPAHTNLLWEEPFNRPVLHGFVFSVGSGFKNE